MFCLHEAVNSPAAGPSGCVSSVCAYVFSEERRKEKNDVKRGRRDEHLILGGLAEGLGRKKISLQMFLLGSFGHYSPLQYNNKYVGQTSA